MRLFRALLTVCALSLACGGATAATRPVSSLEELASELKTASAGDTIMVAAGSYGTIVTAAAFSGPVTITSADPRNPARFAGLQLTKARNIVFRDLDIGRARGAEPAFARIIDISGGGDIGIVGGSVHGSLDGDPSNDMVGLKASSVTGLRVSGVVFQELVNGMILDRSSAVTVEENEFTMIRSDGIDLPGSSQVQIMRNRFADFAPAAGDHPDAIQCWTKGVPACSDVKIANNLFLAVPGREMQGVFFGDEDKLAAQGKGYRSVQVVDNLFISPMWNAIAFSPTEELTITGNVILNAPGSTMTPKIYTQAPAIVTGNTAPTFAVQGFGAGDVPPGNVRAGSPSQQVADAALSAWTAAFRPPAGPSKDEILAKIGALVSSLDAAWAEYQTAR